MLASLLLAGTIYLYNGKPLAWDIPSPIPVGEGAAQYWEFQERSLNGWFWYSRGKGTVDELCKVPDPPRPGVLKECKWDKTWAYKRYRMRGCNDAPVHCGPWEEDPTVEDFWIKEHTALP